MTDTIGLVFWKDPGGCCVEEDGWEERPREQQGGQLGAPTIGPEASPRSLAQQGHHSLFWTHFLSSQM